jgi:glyoxylase-like metal-dependent hydrolase (beta-lactamase superfamily II)
MEVLMQAGGVAMTNCIVVADEKAREAVMFDAPDHTTRRLLDEVRKRGWSLTGLWLTHGHFDHFADHAEVMAAFPSAKLLMHSSDASKLARPDLQTGMFGLPFEIPPGKPHALVEDGQKLSVGALEVRVMHTPGHSPGHVSYFFPAEKLLIGGDLIIGGSVGRTDLPESNHPQLEESVRKVMALGDDVRLLGGHGGASTLGMERADNYFVREALGLE